MLREDFCGCSAVKRRPKFQNYLMLLAHNSMRSCLLEFNFCIFVENCSSLSSFEWSMTVSNLLMSRFISLVILRCFCCTESSTLLYSKFLLSFFRNTAENQLDVFGYASVSGLQSLPPLATSLRGPHQSRLSRPKSKRIKKWSIFPAQHHTLNKIK